MSKLTKIFLNGLNQILKEHYDPAVVARYAYEFYLDNDIEDTNLEYVVDYVKGMDAGPEFELTEKELLTFIKNNLD
ncbi:hypothetical protein RBA69_03705 [Brenneria goodwinii]|uniref:hypothetical protein n=1 Tax=Brenneria goodwinii TaxID=1109412 RepID=UPI0036DFBD24